MNYPSRKTTWMIILAAIIVGGAFLFAKYRNGLAAEANYSSQQLSATADSNAAAANSDSDWQKVLINADPAAAAATAPKSLAMGNTPANSQPLSETDKLGRDLFTQYAQLENEGLASDPDSISAAVSQTLNDGTVFAAPKRYLPSNLNISIDNSSVSLRDYANSLSMLFQTHNAGQGTEVELATEAGQGNTAALAGIDPIIANYQAILTSLLSMPTPQAVANAHLDVVNAMSTILSTAKLLRHSDVDPVAGIEGISQYPAGVQALVAGLNEVGGILRSSNVVFAATDPGKVLENSLPMPGVSTATQ